MDFGITSLPARAPEHSLYSAGSPAPGRSPASLPSSGATIVELSAAAKRRRAPEPGEPRIGPVEAQIIAARIREHAADTPAHLLRAHAPTTDTSRLRSLLD